MLSWNVMRDLQLRIKTHMCLIIVYNEFHTNFIPTMANDFICFSFRYWPNRKWKHTFSKELREATFLVTCVIKVSPSRVVSRGTRSCTQDNTSTTALFAGKDLMKAQITRPTWEFTRVSSIIVIIAPNPLSRNVRYRIIYRNILDNIDSRVTSVVKDSIRKLTMINTLNTTSHKNTEDSM